MSCRVAEGQQRERGRKRQGLEDHPGGRRRGRGEARQGRRRPSCGGVARAKRKLQNLLRDDDLARRFIGILAEIARGNADFEAILRAGAYMINELGASESTVEQVIAAYDGLPQPADTIQ